VVLVNGVASDSISVADRGLLYGDGVFRTFPARKGIVNAWRRHCEKLKDDCGRLGIRAPDSEVLESDLAHALAGVPDAAVKIIITRGVGERGYALPRNSNPTRIVSTAPLPAHPREWAEQGVKVRVCDVKLSMQRSLAGVKHLNRLENVLARAEWGNDDFAEGLLLDDRGNVIEGTMSNLFIWSGGVLSTPKLDRCGVAGVTRDRVLDFAREKGIRTEMRDIRLDEILDAEEVFFTNSIITLWRVRELNERLWTSNVMAAAVRDALEKHET
jgi:4-amino-4-deoxychorismate lyase